MAKAEELVSFFHRHVVPVFFSMQKGKEVQKFVLTAFVLSISEHWFLITAGHCIRAIEILISDGYKIVQSQLIDSLALGAKHLEPIPFDYSNSHPVCLSDEYAFDYGIMALSPYYKGLLLQNNVEALNEEVWKKQPQTVEFYMLLGVPAELVKFSDKDIEIVSLLFFVEQIDQKPEEFTEVDTQLFYGRIVFENEVLSIKGVSGGPIFAFQKNENGELKYWLTALQSRWLPDSHLIAACPTKLLGHFLEDIII